MRDVPGEFEMQSWVVCVGCFAGDLRQKGKDILIRFIHDDDEQEKQLTRMIRSKPERNISEWKR